jgi:ABC-type dipeptide/oligopeptide/nickel transport system permease component
MNLRIFIQRLLQLIPVLFGVSLVTFSIIHLAPGDPVLLLVSSDATMEEIQEVRHELGLDGPLPIQYLSWLGKVLTGDLGRSIFAGKPVLGLVLQRFPATLLLTVSAMTFAIIVGVSLGLVASLRRDTALDRLTMVGSVMGWSMPSFWLGLVLIILFSVKLGWLPTGGMYNISSLNPTVPDVAKHLILPALTLGLRHMSYVARLTRSSMLEVLGEDYIRTARAKGLRDRVVTTGHALRNTLIPIITVAGVSVGRLLGGAVVVEAVFGWPGLGTLTVTGILNRDFPLVQGAVLFIAVLFILVNFSVDMIYAWIDPRIRYS